jgi:phytoene dehydrogenase-like protein
MAFEIVIIGAGASGLMAAACLAKDHPVTVLEARNRPGGRVHTLENIFSIPAEAGAEFIHGQQPVTMSLMVESKQ